MHLGDLSEILWATRNGSDSGDDGGPVAGQMTAQTEIFLLGWAVGKLPGGSYRYVPDRHSLVPVSEEVRRSALKGVEDFREAVDGVAATLILGAVALEPGPASGNRDEEGRCWQPASAIEHSALHARLRSEGLGLPVRMGRVSDSESVSRAAGIPRGPVLTTFLAVGSSWG